MKHLVLGAGEIGTAISAVLDCDYADKEGTQGQYDVIHICFPYSEAFNLSVRQYQKKHQPQITVIHSTVPVGTSKKLNAVHSPVRGVHPHLEGSIRTFVKFMGGAEAEKVANIFREKGVKCIAVANSDDTEAGKLWSTTGYGLNIILEKAVHTYCKENNLDFEVVYGMFNETYNQGYAEMDMPQFTKYNLKHISGKLGGHCIIPNCYLLGGAVAQWVLDQNDLPPNDNEDNNDCRHCLNG